MTYTVTASGSDKVLVNVSTRGVVEDGDGVMIGGFIVTSTKPKQVLLRAIGPSLAAVGVAGALSDPKMELYDSAGTLIRQNDNSFTVPPEVSAAGLAPQNPSESLITARLSPGAYTCVIRGMNGARSPCVRSTI